MPLLHKQKFNRKTIPPNLDPNEEIFFCKLTQEIFLDYDEYFERTILCNSLVWTCSLSGKSGLTYSEALQSEEKARQSLTSFPEILEKVVVYLAMFTKRGNIKDLLDDVFGFVKDRYFIGEFVSVIVGQTNNSRGEIRKTYKIFDVVPPSESDLDDSSDDDDESENDEDDAENMSKSKARNKLNPKADKYKYIIETQTVSGNANKLTVRAGQVSRPKGLLTKDKVQIVLKMACEAINNIWFVTESAKEKYSINGLKFENIFKGELPKFDVSFGRGKFSKTNQLSKASPSVNSNKLNTSNAAANRSKTTSQSPSHAKSVNNMKKSHSTSAIASANGGIVHNRKSLNTSASAKLSSKIKKKYSRKKVADDVNNKGLASVDHKLKNGNGKLKSTTNHEELCRLAETELKRLESEKLMDMKILEMTDDEFQLWYQHVDEESLGELFEIDMEYEKVKRKEEREKERKRVREEKRTQKEYLKELNKPKEDLDCENLTDLPKSICIKTKIPTNQFGDALMIVEFLNCFGDLFDLHIDFPSGFNIEQLESAIFSKSCHSALCNLLLFYLDWIFKCYDEEKFEDVNASDNEDANDLANDSDDEEISIDQLYKEPIKEANTDRDNFVKLAEKYSKLIRNSQGRSLKTIGLDVYTISEMLRLYFLTSGSLNNQKIKFWYQQRGGYTNLDDIGIDFALYESDIVKKLENVNVFELEPEEKLKILSSLCHQLITQVRFRDLTEDNFQKISTLRAQLRDMQTEENRRLREIASDRWKKKLDDKAKQKTRLEEIKTNVVSKSSNQKEIKIENEDLVREDFQSKQQADESQKKREEFLKKEKQILDEIHEAQIRYSLAPLGKDRYYRRYWIFKSIAGVFVEDDDQFTEQLFELIETKQEMNDTDSSSVVSTHELKATINGIATSSSNASCNNTSNVGKENNPLLTSHTANTSNLSCSNILSNSYFNTSDMKLNQANFKKGEVKWSFYYKLEDIEKLISSLTERGLRESELKQNLVEFKNKIVEKLNKFPLKHLVMSEDELQKHAKELDIINNLKIREFYLKKLTANGHQNGTASNQLALAHDFLEIDFRDKLLDIEEQIFNGGLGSLKVSDRIKWKQAIEKGKYDPQCDSILCGDVATKAVDCTETDSLKDIISGLSRALLQIEQSVERKFLRLPLGDIPKTPDKMKNKAKKIKHDEDSNDAHSNSDSNKLQTLMNWEKSLLNCTSLSQLFVHFQSLDESITWSKSCLNARCKLCRKKGDADKMILCDKCDRGHHTFCLRPVLKVLPAGKWLCAECRPKNVEKQPRKMRKSFIEQENDLFSEEDDDKKNNYHDNDEENLNSDEDVVIDDSNDACDSKKNKPRKRKLEKSDSDIIAPVKTRGRPPGLKQLKLTTGSITSNDSNQSGSSRSKQNAKQNGYHDESEMQSEDEINSYEEVVPRKTTKRNRNATKSPVDFNFNSSSRNTELTQRLKITEKLVADLMKHSDAWPFLKPVTKREAPDYFEIIEKPMDFQSIKNKINHLKYQDYSNILDDIRLTFANCRTYNEPSSEIYKIGQRLSNFFEKQIKKLNLI